MSNSGGGNSSSAAPAQANTTPAVGSLRLQQSSYGTVIPVIYGTARVAGNMIWYGDFTAIPNIEVTSGGGGSSGGGGATTTTTYTYTASFAFGLGSGTVRAISQIWWDKSQYSMGSMPATGTLKLGDGNQTTWDYLNSVHPEAAMPYRYLAYVGLQDVALGTSTSMPNISFEVQGQGTIVTSQWIPFGTSAVLQYDTSPAYCIADLLTNPDYGAGFPAARLADLSNYAGWCQAMGLPMSVALTEARPARDIITEWLASTLAEAVWSAGQLKIIPYVDEAILDATANALGYAPNLTPVMTIDDSIMLAEDGDPPLTVTRQDPADASNRITVEYIDRSYGYNTVVVTSDDAAHIATYGLRVADVVSAHHIVTASAAQQVADLLCDRSVNVAATYEWLMGPLGALLEPMDLVSISDPDQGLVNYTVRVTEIDEESDSSFRVTAEDVPDSLAGTTTRPVQDTQGFAADYSQTGGDCTAPAMFEPPDALTANGLELWLAVTGGPVWGGCDVWISEDGATYKKVGSSNGPARYGQLTAELPSGAAIDQTDTLSVQLCDTRRQMLSGSLADATALNTLCWVDGEWLAYQSATLMQAGGYQLNYLVRGAYGSSIADHAAGAPFVRIDNALIKYPFRMDQIGKTLYVKLLSFNIWGGALQDISEVQPYSYTLRGLALLSPLPNITGLTTVFVAGNTQMVWTEVEDFRTVDYEIRQGLTWQTARVIGRTPLCQAPCYGDGTYWLAAHYRASGGIDVYSAQPAEIMIEGSILVSNVLAGFDEAASGWTGSLSSAVVLNGAVQMTDASDLTLTADVRSVADLLYGAGVAAAASYTVPVGHRIDVGRAVLCNVVITVAAHGQSVFENLCTVTDVLAISDLTDAFLGPKIDAVPQIRLSPDGVTWGAWQNWAPGSYLARAFDLRVLLSSADPQVIPILTGLSFLVDVPDRDDWFTGLAVPAAGVPVLYASGLQGNPAAPFNGGPGSSTVPNIQITIVNAQQGDDAILSNQSTSGFTVQVLNGGIGVARTVNIVAQGY
ncbi:MAG TPA: phage tail protein [Patescibacteria group bacterium]|nr:phage tail protein [Patescibacteria group bacterium]